MKLTEKNRKKPSGKNMDPKLRLIRSGDTRANNPYGTGNTPKVSREAPRQPSLAPITMQEPSW